MTTDSNTTASAGRVVLEFGIGKFLYCSPLKLDTSVR
jgi:hypothetical protein